MGRKEPDKKIILKTMMLQMTLLNIAKFIQMMGILTLQIVYHW